MLTAEARVFVVEDHQPKLDRVTKLVEYSGGQVVGSADDVVEVHGLIHDPGFPESVGGANIVVFDGNLGGYGGNGEDGMDLFHEGYEIGVLHRVDAVEGIGAVAVGCSYDDHSKVIQATGGNIGRMLQDDDRIKRWAELIEPHPVEPVYLDYGALERKLWASSFDFQDVMHEVIDPEVISSFLVHGLDAREEVVNDEGEVVGMSASNQVRPAEYGYKDFIEKVVLWQGLDGVITTDSGSAKAVIESGEYIYVVDQSFKVNRQNGTKLKFYTKTDKIAIAGLADMPSAYWENLGLERPAVTQVN